MFLCDRVVECVFLCDRVVESVFLCDRVAECVWMRASLGCEFGLCFPSRVGE